MRRTIDRVAVLLATTAAWAGGGDDGVEVAYRAAVENAKNPEPAEVVHNLFAIDADNGNLRWKSIDDERYVQMVTLTGYSYAAYAGGAKPYDYPVDAPFELWVMAAPQLQAVCSRSDFGAVDGFTLRLNRLMGFPPSGDYPYAVSFWVRPADLFRPCPDGEVDDETCNLNFPSDVPPSHRKWINDVRAKQYYTNTSCGVVGYPWTQLGYTYDWGSVGEVGMSEYLIRPGSTFWVDAQTTPEAYCGK